MLTLGAPALERVLREYYKRRWPGIQVIVRHTFDEMEATLYRTPKAGGTVHCVRVAFYPDTFDTHSDMLTWVTDELNDDLERTWGRFAPVCSVTGEPCVCYENKGRCANL